MHCQTALLKNGCISVSEDAIKKTTKCRKNFSCLSGETPLCKVEQCIGKEVIFVKCKDEQHCMYKISTICTCPVRKELYNRYQI